MRIAQKKLRAIATAERKLKLRLEEIDWQENVLLEALKDLQYLASVGQLPEVELTEDGGVLKRLEAARKEEDAKLGTKSELA